MNNQKSRIFLSISLGALLLSGCTNTASDTTFGISYVDTLPKSIDEYPKEKGAMNALRTSVAKGANNNEQIRSLLNCYDIKVTIRKLKISGGLSAPFISAKMDKGTYVIQQDFMHYRTMPKADGKSQRVGIIFRTECEFHTLEGDLSINTPYAVATAVKAGKAEGTIAIKVFGITGPAITDALPLPTEINEASIQNALVAIGVVKSKLNDASTIYDLVILPDQDIETETQLTNDKCAPAKTA